MAKPPDDLKEWSKNDLVRELRRVRAIMHEHSERVGDDARRASTPDPIIGGSPHGRGDALIDARAMVLLDYTEVVLMDTKADEDPVAMVLSMAGRINYSDDRVTHAYLFGPDGAAALVTQIVALAQRAKGDDGDGERFAQAFGVALQQRMQALEDET